MNCAPYDLRDYFWEELGAGERRQVEVHLEGCARCREELGRWQATRRSLLLLKDEEVPRRIAFISDKVFEPSRAARWWAAFSSRAPAFAFSLSLLLAVFFAGVWVSRPSITVEKGRWQIAFGASDARIEQAVAAVEARHAADMRDVKDSYELLEKEMSLLYRQSADVRAAAFRQ